LKNGFQEEETVDDAKPNREYNGAQASNSGRFRIRTLKSPDCSKVIDFFQMHRSFFNTLAVSLGLLTILASLFLLLQYHHYAKIVDQRLSSQALHYPSGLYASRVRLMVGKQISKEDLRERLLRAGYAEGTEASDFTSGNFMVTEDAIEIHTAEAAQEAKTPASIRVSFATQAGKDRARITTGISRITDERGQSLRDFALAPEMLTAGADNRSQTRRATSYEELPNGLINALCAIEDRRFFDHDGIDVWAMLRAAFRNTREGEVREGASTITQQLVKNLFLSPERTYQRKFSEAMMALAIERRLSKEQILALYCEHVYLGQSGYTAIYGFKQAAQVYFGKSLSELTLAQAATLAGMAKAPSRYSPYTRLPDTLARRNLVLDCMLEEGKIRAEEAAAAKNETLAALPPKALDNSSAPHFVDYVKQELVRRNIDEEDIGRFRIETSLDPELQRAATQVVSKQLEHIYAMVGKRQKGERPEAALVAIDPHTGQILAMVGGRDYATSQLNRVTDARRQPGSVFKPFVYAAALAHGVSPTEMFDNSPQEFHFGYKAVYKPGNYHDSYTNQPVTLREGMVRSLNVVTVAAAMHVGLGRVADMARRSGLTIPQLYPSMALGAFETTPLTVAQAYTTFANEGMNIEPYGVESVRSDSRVIAGGSSAKASVLTPSAAYVVTDTLSDVVNRGTAARVRHLGYQGPAAGKTGTSKDAWFVGYTPSLLVVVWVGNDDNKDLGLTGGEAAVPMWTDFINQALALRPDLRAESFAKPAGVQTLEICAGTGMIANEYCPNRVRVVMPSYVSTGICTKHPEQIPVALETTYEIDEADSTSQEINMDEIEKELDKTLQELERSKEEREDRQFDEPQRLQKVSGGVPKLRRYE
jgi:penicillin-binding protein 1B